MLLIAREGLNVGLSDHTGRVHLGEGASRALLKGGRHPVIPSS